MSLCLAILLALLSPAPAGIDYPVPPLQACRFYCRAAQVDLAMLTWKLGTHEEPLYGDETDECCETVTLLNEPFLPAFRRQEIGLLFEEAQRIRAIWEAALAVAKPQTDPAARDRAIAYLREALGDDAYCAGRLPLPLSCR